MRLYVLGPVELRAGSQTYAAGTPRQSMVLAALAADAGLLVPVDVLVERVWGQRPPDRARRTLHTYVARIRRLLEQAVVSDGGQGGADERQEVRLIRRSAGYLLDIDRDRIDIYRFGGLVERAREAGRVDEERVAMLRESLDLWRGEPLAGLHGDWADRVRDGWKQTHLAAVVDWAHIEVRLRNPEAVIARLLGLVADNPLVEPLSAALMRALHAAGRGAEALDLYAALRRRLAEELGANPGPDLQQVHLTILRNDTAPSAPTPIAVKGQVPSQLPLDVLGFAGRTGELAGLDALLDAAKAQPTAVVVLVVSGTAGVGKTALAVHWAHRVAGRFPDGQMYTNLRGFDPSRPAMTTGEAVRGFLEALGVTSQQMPTDLAGQIGLYRSMLAGRRLLVVLDNARDAAQVRPLLPGAPGCAAVVTSRDQLSSLIAAEAAHPIALGLLSVAEARDMLAHRLGVGRVDAEPAAVEEIIDLSARLPLALAVVAARAAAHVGFPLGAVASELRASRGRLDAFASADPTTNVRAVFSWSYRTLSPASARLFRLLGLSPALDVDAAGAASLAGVAVQPAGRLLTELASAHLATEHILGRFVLHDLLRAYAGEASQAHDNDTEQRAAIQRILDHYLITAYAADRCLHPHRDPITPPAAQPHVTLVSLAGCDQMQAWLAAERANLLAAVTYAARAGLDDHCWRIAWTLTTYLDQCGQWNDLLASHEAALAAASRLGDPNGQAHIHLGLALAHARLGRSMDSVPLTVKDHLDKALALFVELEDAAGQAQTLLDFAWVSHREGRFDEAVHHARRAGDLYRSVGHDIGLARALNTRAWYQIPLGHHRDALANARRSLRLDHLGSDVKGTADTWDTMGYAHYHLGRHARAIACFHRALDLYRGIGYRHHEASTLDRLGDTHLAAGDPASARQAWRSAHAILADLRAATADKVKAKLGALDRP